MNSMNMNANKIYSLIPKIMQEIGAIGKDGKNTVQNYEYRKIEDMYNEIQPALIKFGVFCVPQVTDKFLEKFTSAKGAVTFHTVLTVCHKFFADDGSFVEVITVGEGLDTSDKSSNKAMSGAMKYAFIELLSLPTKSVEDSDRGGVTVDDDTGEKEPPAKQTGFTGKQAPPQKQQVQQQPPQQQAQAPRNNGFGGIKTTTAPRPDPLRPPDKEPVPFFGDYDNDNFNFNQEQN